MTKYLSFATALLFAACVSLFASVNPAAASALAKRISPVIAANVIFEPLSGVPATEKIVYELESTPAGKLIVRGNTTVALTSGFYQFLKEFCHVQITWGAHSVPALKKGTVLPRIPQKIRVESPLVLRYAYNYCTHGYTMSWWDWEQWEKEIDWLALHGFNLALVIQGQDAVWQNTFTKFGYTKEEMRKWLCAPSHMPWQFMGNMEAMLPPSQSIIDKRTKLGKEIVSRMRQLGIQPVLQGYYGMVPYKFKEKHPGARIVAQGGWAGGQRRPDMLNPADPLFAPIAEAFYTEQKKLFGDCYYFAADPFHEGGSAGDMNRGTVYRQVQDAMLAFEPKAVLVKQCWQTSNAEMFSAGKKDHSLALDLYADKHPFWQNCNGYDGTPWLWCLLQNFGGNTGMEGDLQGLCAGLKRALTAPNRGKLVGVGIVPEGSFNNPVIFELLSDIAVRGNVPENIGEWLIDYQTSRYGKTTQQLEQSWKILLKTAYSYTAKEGPLNSALPARPRFGNFIKARFWASNMALPYDNTELLKALQLFDSQKNLFAKKATFRYDYADLQRQVIDNLSHAVYARLNAAWNAKDKTAYADASKDFLRLFELCDARFSQFPKYKNDARNFSQSLEKWLSDAQKFGTKKDEKAYLKNCAQTHLTTWVEQAGTNLDDYAFREWIGLNDTYYAKRWEMFFDETKKALAAGTAFDQKAFDRKLNAFEDKWSANPKHKVKITDGNTTAEIAKLVKKYAGTNLSGGARPDDSPLGVQNR